MFVAEDFVHPDSVIGFFVKSQTFVNVFMLDFSMDGKIFYLHVDAGGFLVLIMLDKIAVD